MSSRLEPVAVSLRCLWLVDLMPGQAVQRLGSVSVAPDTADTRRLHLCKKPTNVPNLQLRTSSLTTTSSRPFVPSVVGQHQVLAAYSVTCCASSGVMAIKIIPFIHVFTSFANLLADGRAPDHMTPTFGDQRHCTSQGFQESSSEVLLHITQSDT